MRHQRILTLLLGIAVGVCLGGSSLAEAAARHTGKKRVAVSKGKRTTKKKASRARASGPPRQRTPDPERYREIQQALADRGHYTGPVDGKWSPECLEALRRFQQAENLNVDGKLGAQSLIALGLGPKREPMPANLIPPVKPELKTGPDITQ